MKTLRELAAEARPINDDDWSSDRQITAENLFFEKAIEKYPDLLGDKSEFANYCLKATVEEMIDEALRLIDEVETVSVFVVEAEHTLDKTRRREGIALTRDKAAARVGDIARLIGYNFTQEQLDSITVFHCGIIKLHIIVEPVL